MQLLAYSAFQRLVEASQGPGPAPPLCCGGHLQHELEPRTLSAGPRATTNSLTCRMHAHPVSSLITITCGSLNMYKITPHSRRYFRPFGKASSFFVMALGRGAPPPPWCVPYVTASGWLGVSHRAGLPFGGSQYASDHSTQRLSVHHFSRFRLSGSYYVLVKGASAALEDSSLFSKPFPRCAPRFRDTSRSVWRAPHFGT